MAKTSERIRLTERTVNSAQPLPEGSPYRHKVFWDNKLPGFGLLVGASSKSFIIQKDVKGRAVRITIGRCPPYTVEQARKEAKELLVRMSKGENPNETKKQEKIRGITLQQALDLYLETMRAKGRKTATADEYSRVIKLYLHDWLNKPLIDISRADIRARHKKIAADVVTGKYIEDDRVRNYSGRNTANAVMVIFRAVWNRAMKEDESLGISPTINCDWYRIERRTVNIPTSDLHKWYAQVMLLPNSIRRDYLRFLLFSGLRKSNAAEVEWQHVDFEKRILHVPKPKSGRPFDLPLSDALLELLQERKKQNVEVFGADNPWVFPALSKSGHLMDGREHFDGLKWSIHDCRRWFITVAESLDISPYSVKLIVNHSLTGNDVTGRYVQHEVERLRGPMQAITDRLRILCTPPDDKVKVLPSISGRVKVVN